MPVAVAPVDRQPDIVGGKVGTNSGEQLPALVVDRAPATVAVVVLPYLREPFGWDAAAAGDVLQERDHVVRALRPAKRQEQQRVVGHPVHLHPSWHPPTPAPATNLPCRARYAFRLDPAGQANRPAEAEFRHLDRRAFSLRCGGPAPPRWSSDVRWRRPLAAPTLTGSICCDPDSSHI